MKLPALSFVIVSLVLSSLFLQPTLGDGAPAMAPAAPSFCDSKCGARCSKAAVNDRCIKYCKLCCQQCNCVPSGTYGNKSECPCYRDKLNSKGKPKCP